MGAIGGVLGTAGGQSGTGITQIGSGVTDQQINQSYDQTQGAMKQQQDLLTALQGQNGLQNQSNVYGQLQGVAAGTGPNPAQAMLNQSTGQNVANQAALMAGQRGAGANAGLMARQAGMQGGNLQQQAVGQGATMQAQQSMNALGQMGNMANTQVANQIGATGAYTGAAQAGQANLLNAQAGANSANAGLASGVMTGQREMLGGFMNPGGAIMGGNKAHGGVVGMADGGMTPFDSGITPITGPQSSFGQFMSKVNTAPAPNFGNQNSQLKKGAGAGMDKAVKTLKDWNTPQNPNAAMTQGNVPPPNAATPATPGADTVLPGAESVDAGAETAALGGSEAGAAEGAGLMAGAGEAAEGASALGELASVAALASKGGMVDVMVSPGEKIVSPGGEVKAVPGKAKVKGDSEENDTVKTKLSAGTIVVPRTKAKDERSSAEFVRKTLAKRGKK